LGMEGICIAHYARFPTIPLVLLAGLCHGLEIKQVVELLL
jgi:hypothetical protein